MSNKKALFAAYSQLMQLQDEYKVFPADLPLPELLVVGEQSSGKSSLLEFYIGFPCNFVAAGTGTRCPIRFHLTTTCPSGIPPNTSKVRDELVPNDQVAAKIEEVMQAIAKGAGGFSDEVLSVSIYNAQMDAVLLDLPGMIPNPQNKLQSQTVLKIITDRMNANKNCSIIALLEASRHWDNAVTIGQLKDLWDQKELHFDWRDRTIIVGTKLDTVTSGNSDNLVSALQADGNVRSNFMAVSLNPQGLNRGAQTYSSWSKYLTEIADKEQQVIRKLQQSIQNWNNAWNDHLGLTNTKHVIEDLLMKSLEKCLAELIGEIQSKLDSTKGEIDSAQENIDLLDPAKRKEAYLQRYEEYMSRLRRLYGGDSFLLKDGQGHACVLRSHKTDWKYFKTVEDIEKEYKNEIPALQMTNFKANMFGGAHMRRLTSFFRVLIAAAPNSDYTLEQLVQFDGGVHHTSQWNYEKSVFEGVKFTIRQWFHNGLTWLGEEVKAALLHLHQCVVEDMPGLPFTISKIFQESIELFVKEAISTLQDEVAKKCAFQIHDLPWLMSVTPDTISSVEEDGEEIRVDFDPKMKEFAERNQEVGSKQVVKLLSHRFPFYLKANRYEDDPPRLVAYLNSRIKQMTTTLKIILLIDIEFGVESRINQKVHNANLSEANKKLDKESLAVRLINGVWETDATLDTATLQKFEGELAKWKQVRKVLEDSILAFQSHARSPLASSASNGQTKHAPNNNNINRTPNNFNATNGPVIHATFTAPSSPIKGKAAQIKAANVDDATLQQLLLAENKAMTTLSGKDSVLQTICASGTYKDVSELRKAVHTYATTAPAFAKKKQASIDKLADENADLTIEFLVCFGASANRPVYVYTTDANNHLTCYEAVAGMGPAIGLALTRSNTFQVVTDKI